MSFDPKKYASSIEFIGIIIFFIVYKFAPAQYHVAYAAGALLIVTIFQLLYYWYFKIKMPRHVLFLNVLAIVFTVPAVIYNSLYFIRIKLIIIKSLFFLVPAGFLLFKKNFFFYFFKDMTGFNHLSKKQFDHINYWFVIVAGISLLMTIWAAYALNDDAFVTFKTFWLTIVSSAYIIPIVYHVYKNEQAQEKERKRKERIAKAKGIDPQDVN